MKNKDKDRIIERYNERLREHGFSINALASGNDERRNLRFKILTEIGIKNGDTILDLGCGFADFHTYLLNVGIAVNYIGIDINSEIIRMAKEKKSELDLRVVDILNDKFDTPVDYIVSTSSFNNKLFEESNYSFIETLLKKCQSIAKKGVAIDFLSSYVDFKVNDEVFYYEPEKIVTIAKSITKKVCIRHDYELFEFCLYMYPDFKGWAKK
jgi:SAM-dependent methyltransferase